MSAPAKQDELLLIIDKSKKTILNSYTDQEIESETVHLNVLTDVFRGINF